MPQAQNVVEIELKGGGRSRGIATGNNAAWICACGREEPLLGRTGLLSGPSEGTRVLCPDCDRKYFVAPNGKDQGAVLKVVELG